MRSACLMFALALTLGCRTAMHDPKVTFATSFTPPALTRLEPNTVSVNSSPFILLACGKNFGLDSIVFWNHEPQSTRFVDSTQLQVSITIHDLTQFGLAQVYVQTAGMTSNTVDFDTVDFDVTAQ